MNTAMQKPMAPYPTNQLAGIAASVNQCADNALESASRARSYAECLLGDLRQMNNAEMAETPCRSGIDGKMQDAMDHSDVTLKVLQELRAYLLG